MAIGTGSIVGKLRKSYGDAVFYVLAGQQIVRSKSGRRATPSTENQVVQQTKMRSTVGAFKLLKPVLEVGYGVRGRLESQYNAFVKYNVQNTELEYQGNTELELLQNSSLLVGIPLSNAVYTLGVDDEPVNEDISGVVKILTAETYGINVVGTTVSFFCMGVNATDSFFASKVLSSVDVANGYVTFAWSLTSQCNIYGVSAWNKNNKASAGSTVLKTL
jgi:hypothetical protein